ncbi:MAG: GNAT family N-acetyltransferase [Candidatus Dormibacteraceae bacterium]
MDTDPELMAGLGGPRAKEAVERAHAGGVEQAAAGECRPCKVLVEPQDTVAGHIVAWLSEHDGEPLHEIGWMILREHQRRGLATAAVRELLKMVWAAKPGIAVHAFPGVTNTASNRVCEKSGFQLLGPCDVRFGEAQLRCSWWRVTPSRARASAVLRSVRAAPCTTRRPG